MKASIACILAAAASAAAYNNGVARKPAMGWNTWCTMATCGNQGTGIVSLHDVCYQSEIQEVAEAMLTNGMFERGYEYINCDDCWAADTRDKQGRIRASPDRFPDGFGAHASWLHARNLKAGLYTSAGHTTCAQGGRLFPIPGSYKHYPSDTQSFADWGVDYVKIDWCGMDGIKENSSVLHTEFSKAMNVTGRHMWLELCRGYSYTPIPHYVVEVAQSWRAAGDHHDEWSSTASAIRAFINETGMDAENQGWAYGDFLMTGGAGCNTRTPGAHCPGMSVEEYRSEFSIWTITSSPLIVATDIRNMTSIMKQALLNDELIAVNQDAAAGGGNLIGYDSKCGATSASDCQVWAKHMSDGTVAVVLHNQDLDDRAISVRFSQLKPSWADQSLYVRDLWQHENLGQSTGVFTATVGSHDAVVVRISSQPMEPVMHRPNRHLVPPEHQQPLGVYQQ